MVRLLVFPAVECMVPVEPAHATSGKLEPDGVGTTEAVLAEGVDDVIVDRLDVDFSVPELRFVAAIVFFLLDLKALEAR
jgi:hypothetical protein